MSTAATGPGAGEPPAEPLPASGPAGAEPPDAGAEPPDAGPAGGEPPDAGPAGGEPPDAGRAALLLVGSRVTMLYLGCVAAAGLVAGPGDRPLRWAASAAALVAAGAGGVTALMHPPRLRWALLLAASTGTAMAVCAAVHPTLGTRDVQVLLGAVGSGVGAGTALAWGPLAGLAATAGVLTGWAGPVRLAAPDVDGGLFVGVLAGGLLGSTGSLFLRRGYGVTLRALAAAEEAVTARLVAAARWRARRQEIRTLHDTVLSTLSLLAQGGAGVDEDALRADCRAQAAFLREAATPTGGAPAGDDVVGGTPRGGALRGGALRGGALRGGALRGGAPTGDAAEGGPAGGDQHRSPADGGRPAGVPPFEALRQRWAARSLDVQVYGTPDALRLGGLAPSATSALLGAVEECLENVRRHAGVQVASVAVACSATELRCTVTDEGRGFDPAARSGHRIGLGDSVVGRVEDVGGAARVWSAPGRGTSVALSVPLATQPGPGAGAGAARGAARGAAPGAGPGAAEPGRGAGT